MKCSAAAAGLEWPANIVRFDIYVPAGFLGYDHTEQRYQLHVWSDSQVDRVKYNLANLLYQHHGLYLHPRHFRLAQAGRPLPYSAPVTRAATLAQVYAQRTWASPVRSWT